MGVVGRLEVKMMGDKSERELAPYLDYSQKLIFNVIFSCVVVLVVGL